MKTKLSSVISLMIVSLSLIIASCKKDTTVIETPVVVVPDTTPVSTVKSASIVDLGLVDGTNRLFRITFTNLDVLVSSSTSELAGKAGKVSFELYSDSDGLVPTGAYYFDLTNNNEPYTFNYGALKSINISGNTSDSFVAGGAVYVSQDSNGYQFSFDCTLKSGSTVHGQYTGNASYEDVE